VLKNVRIPENLALLGPKQGIRLAFSAVTISVNPSATLNLSLITGLLTEKAHVVSVKWYDKTPENLQFRFLDGDRLIYVTDQTVIWDKSGFIEYLSGIIVQIIDFISYRAQGPVRHPVGRDSSR
jgi:hypothetical protein